MRQRNTYIPAGMDKKTTSRARAVYYGQKARCEGSSHKKFLRYGARGIAVEYKINDFLDWYWEQYQAWPKKDDIQVGRKDRSAGYKISNVVFQTRKQNAKEVTDRLGPVQPRKKIEIHKNDKYWLTAESTAEAAKMTGTWQSNIAKYCTGKQICKKGFSFRYVEET